MNKPLVVVLTLAVLTRLIYLWIYQGLPEWEQLTVDNNYHHHWAQSLASGNIIGDTTYFRAPFYSFCLGLLYAVFGPSLWVARLLGIAIGVASVFLTYLLGRRIGNQKIGVIAAVIHAIYPMALYFESELLLDPLFTLLLQISLYRLLVWIDHRTLAGALGVGLMLGLAAITRPTALVLVVPMIVTVIVFHRNIPKWTAQLALFGVGLGLVILPVSARNLMLATDPVLISSQGGINFYIGNNPEANGLSATLPEPMGHNWRIEQIEFEAEQALGRDLKPGEVSSYWATQGWRWIANNPSTFLKLYFEKLYRNFASREISNNRDIEVFSNHHPLLSYNPLCFALLLPLALLGLIGRWHMTSVRVVLWLILVYVATGALFFFTSRFRLPLLPIYFVLTAIGLSDVYQNSRSSLRTLLRPGILVIVISLLSYLPLVPLPVGSTPHTTIAAGLYEYTQGNYLAALRLHQAARRIDSTFPEVNLNVGVAFLRLGKVDSARHYFEHELQFHPNRPKAYTNLGSLLLLEGNLKEAIAAVSESVKRQPYDVTGQSVLLRCIFADSVVGDAAVIEAVYTSAKATDDDIYLLNEAAILLTERGLTDAARSVLNRALNATPPPIETDDEAFAIVFRNSPENIARQRARVHYQLGYLDGKAGKFGQSIYHSQSAITLDSNLSDAYINLISAYLSTGQTAVADSLLTIARQRFPDNPQLRRFQ
ncbi:MAG: glycosyltransferase family 39 protein [candidate division Zixibacteria bacterium]|nr:glycosyltransferase family 39 protein [candidate division Zixibacteria bacterium]